MLAVYESYRFQNLIFVGFEVLSDVHAQCFLIRICFGVRIIGATDVDKHLCEQITKLL